MSRIGQVLHSINLRFNRSNIFTRENLRKPTRNRRSVSIRLRLFSSYFAVAIVCICSMGILLYSLQTKSIKDWTIQSNYELLNQFKNTIDTFIVGSIDDLSRTVLQTAIENPIIFYYFLNLPEGNITELSDVIDLLSTMQKTDPVVNSIAIHYRMSNILVSLEGVRYLSQEVGNNGEYSACLKELYDMPKNCVWYFDSSMSDDNHPLSSAINYIIFARKVFIPTGLSIVAGSIIIRSDEQVLFRAIKSSSPVDFGNMFIIDDRGTIICHTKKEYLGSNILERPYGKEILSSSKKGGFFISHFNKARYVVSYASSERNDWKYVTLKPITKMGEGFQFVGQIILLIAFVMFLLSVLLSLIPTRRFFLPIKQTVNSCRRLVEGLSTSEPKYEFDIINATLSILSQKVREQEIKLEKNFPVMKQRLVLDVMNARYVEKNEINRQMSVLKIAFPFRYFAAVVFKFSGKDNDLGTEDYEFIKCEMSGEIENCLSNSELMCVCVEDRGRILGVLNLLDRGADVAQYIRNIHDNVERIAGRRMYVGIGENYEDITNVYISYTESEKAIKYSYLYPEKSIFTPSDVCQWEQPGRELCKSILDKFCDSLRDRDRDASIMCMHRFIKAICEGQYAYSYAMTLFSLCVACLEDTLRSLKINIDELMRGGDIFSDFSRLENVYAFEKWLETVIDHIFVCTENRNTEKTIQLVDATKKCIERDIMNSNMSLSYVAEAMLISPAYLSHIFKQETGTNFIDYLMNAKLNVAKELLLSGKLKVREISAMIGYSSSQYFIKKFKRRYGMTPVEYRYSQKRGY